MIEIDGSLGEGGGQRVRTSVALAAVLGHPLRVVNVRAKRKKPGLQAQHLAAVKTLAALTAARTEGVELGSTTFSFVPGALRSGTFHTRVSTAGSVGLVVHAALPALLRAPAPTTLTIEGGTHGAYAPPVEHLERAFLPALRAMGAEVELRMERPGFFPKGGGRVVLTVMPWADPRPVALARPSEGPPQIRFRQWGLPEDVIGRAMGAARRLGLAVDGVDADRALGAGFSVTAWKGRDPPDVACEVGGRGVRAEEVVARAAEQLGMLARVPVGPHLADQLLLPMVLGAGGEFLTGPPTLHFETQVLTLTELGEDRVQVGPGAELDLVRVSVR